MAKAFLLRFQEECISGDVGTYATETATKILNEGERDQPLIGLLALPGRDTGTETRIKQEATDFTQSERYQALLGPIRNKVTKTLTEVKTEASDVDEFSGLIRAIPRTVASPMLTKTATAIKAEASDEDDRQKSYHAIRRCS